MMTERKRNYKREAELAKRRGEQGVGSESGNATRNRARRLKEKELGRKLGSDEDVGHKTSLKSGGGNSKSNLKVESKSSNRAKGGKSGNRKAKGKKKA